MGPIGVTAAPLIRSGPRAAVDLARCADEAGYDSFWVAEVTGVEAFSVLGAVSGSSPDDNETLFDFQGQALPSIGMYPNPVAICARSNPYTTPCVIGS